MRDYELVARARERRDEPEHPAIENLESFVRLMDELIRIPVLNVRIGLDPILGLIPGAGDTLTAAFSIYLIGSGIFYGLPKIVILRMAVNVAFDYLIGLLPVVGDVSDVFIKSNRWNLELLRRYAGARTQPGLSDYLFVFVIIGALLAMVAGGILFVFYALRAAGRLW